MSDRQNDVLAAIDGALDDWTVSGDAMRWQPPGVERQTILDAAGVELADWQRNFLASFEAVGHAALQVGHRSGERFAEASRSAAHQIAETAGIPPWVLGFGEPPEPPTPEEFRRRALEHRQNRGTGPVERRQRLPRNHQR